VIGSGSITVSVGEPRRIRKRRPEPIIAGLQNAAKVGLVRLALAQTFDSRRLVSEGLKESKRELHSVERLLNQSGNRFFNFNGVQGLALLVVWLGRAVLQILPPAAVPTSDRQMTA
jgi:hypothetical protein